MPGTGLCYAKDSTRWVGFSDPDAWRFTNKATADLVIRTEPGMSNAFAAEHMWMSGPPIEARGECRDMTFAEAWAVKAAEGYQYGADALEQVRFGWDIRVAVERGK